MIFLYWNSKHSQQMYIQPKYKSFLSEFIQKIIFFVFLSANR